MTDSTSVEKLLAVLQNKWEQNDFLRFDSFFIEQMGLTLKGTQDEEAVRREAYHRFLQNCTGGRPASLPTVRRWFGITDFAEPSREQIFQIGFSLSLGWKETENYLVNGIRQPSFQISDYTEIIAMYCLERHLSETKYESMVEEYESRLERNIEISQEQNTQWLFHQFETVKNGTEEEFLHWMWENAHTFKGYSRTAQEYLDKYREQIVKYVCEEAKKSLDLLLSETDYDVWKKSRKRFHVSKVDELEQIKKYIRWNAKSKKAAISEHLRKNILELARFTYSDRGKNTKLMSELYESSDRETHFFENLPDNPVKVVTGKHLSDLFHIPQRNEIRIRVRQSIWELKKYEPQAECPLDIRTLIQELSKRNISIKTVGEAREWLDEYDRESKRRRLVVKREDLLPMILYVSQQKYSEQSHGYNREEAKKKFTDMANATMIACKMAPLDEHYLYDMIFLECFQEDEMYGYGDVMELI